MDDSDDYFQDSFDLDESDLAVLQQEEDKHALTLTQLPDRVQPPPAKRQKTGHEWTSKTTSEDVTPQALARLDSVAEEVPEIFLREDGSYGVRSEMKGHISVLGANTLNGDNATRDVSQTRPSNPAKPHDPVNSRPRSTGDGPLRPSSNVRHQLRSNGTHNTAVARAKQGQVPTPEHQVNAKRPFNRNLSVGVTNNQMTSLPPKTISSTNSSSAIQEGPSSNLAGISETHLQKEVAALRARLEELNNANTAAQQALRDAQDARYMKEGEVSILRKGIEKAKQDHAADLARLKAAKESAEAKQIQMQKELKEESERLRTQFIFKQHEVETSVRKQTWSVHSRRSGIGAPPTPVPIPAAMRSWGPHKASADPNVLVKDTPTPARSRLGREIQPPSPRTTKRKSVAIEPAFPGFENSFLPSSPVKSPTVRKSRAIDLENQRDQGQRGILARGKGEERASAFTEFASRLPSSDPLQSPCSSPTRNPRKQNQMQDVEIGGASPLGINYGRGSSPIGDLDMSVGVDTEMGEADVDQQDICEDFEGIDWRDELHRMLFTHTSKVSSGLTFHLLLTTSLPSNLSPPLIQIYQAACTETLEVIGTRSKYAELDELMSTIAIPLVKMTQVLLEAGCFLSLMAVLDLFTSLILFIPSFTLVLLKIDTHHDGSPNPLLKVLCDVIRDYLQVPDDNVKSDIEYNRLDLAAVTVTLLEALCWTVPKDLVDKLAILVRHDRTFLTLLADRQPPELIARTIQLLVIISSHFTLFRPLLSFPDPDIPLNPEPPKDYSRIPLIERLCSFLVDSTSLAGEAMQSLSSILNFIALLSVAHPESMVILLESNSLIPSLVHYLTQLTTFIWEDDETVMTSSTIASATVRVITQALHLLHHLVFTPKPTYNLRQKLHYAPYNDFNGLTHMFIVMIGRLSYADPPDWLAAQSKTEIEQITDLARDLMDLIIEGPEGDSIWAAYQGGDESAMEVDDEEIEARSLDTNEID